MRAYIESVLPCSAELAWEEVQTPALLQEVARPIITFRSAPGAQLPKRWHEGMTIHCRPYLLGLIPLGIRTLYFERVDAGRYEIQTREYDGIVRRWDHRIRVSRVDESHCRYSDEIEIDAGPLTKVVSFFAHVFYRHRQARWLAVAKRLQIGT